MYVNIAPYFDVTAGDEQNLLSGCRASKYMKTSPDSRKPARSVREGMGGVQYGTGGRGGGGLHI